MFKNDISNIKATSHPTHLHSTLKPIYLLDITTLALLLTERFVTNAVATLPPSFEFRKVLWSL